jgi:hypothetical protein
MVKIGQLHANRNDRQEPESRAGEVSESRLEKAIDRRHVRFPGVLAERHRQFLDISKV